MTSNVTEVVVEEAIESVSLNLSGHDPTLFVRNQAGSDQLFLNLNPDLFNHYYEIGIYLPGACQPDAPKSVEAFDTSAFEGVKIDGPIGIL